MRLDVHENAQGLFEATFKLYKWHFYGSPAKTHQGAISSLWDLMSHAGGPATQLRRFNIFEQPKSGE